MCRFFRTAVARFVYAEACLRQGARPVPRARLLVGFVLDEVRREDLTTRSTEALGDVVEREAAERAHQEHGCDVVVGGGRKVALLSEGVEVLED